MQEKRIIRSYSDTKPAQDFRLPTYADADLSRDELISARLSWKAIKERSIGLKRGQTVRDAVTFA